MHGRYVYPHATAVVTPCDACVYLHHYHVPCVAAMAHTAFLYHSFPLLFHLVQAPEVRIAALLAVMFVAVAVAAPFYVLLQVVQDHFLLAPSLEDVNAEVDE